MSDDRYKEIMTRLDKIDKILDEMQELLKDYEITRPEMITYENQYSIGKE
jgi:F0F1-type ATP synthase membrane subunit b/b'